MLGSLISAGANLIGGILGNKQQDKALEAQQAIAAQNRQDQYEFAQNAIQWKARDATMAGLHPYFAMGAQTANFSPVSVGAVGGNPLGDAIGRAGDIVGQDISRAEAASRSPKDRANQFAKVAEIQSVQSNSLRLENMKLQNDLLRSQLAKVNQPGTPPGVPFTVSDDSKTEPNPPLMMGGSRVPEDIGWSPAKAVADRWGDESLATNIYGNVKAIRDLRNFYGINPDAWRSGLTAAGAIPVNWWAANNLRLLKKLFGPGAGRGIRSSN